MIVVKRKVFVVVLSLVFALPALAGGHVFDTGANEGPGQISRNSSAISETSAAARAARAAAGRAVRIARSSDARARNAERIARANAARNERQADHAHLSRDYGATIWRHLWGDEGAPVEARKVHRENGGFSGLLWGKQPPTEREFRRFSDNGGLVGTVLFSEGRLDTHTIALWVIGVGTLVALALSIFGLFRSRSDEEERDDSTGDTGGTGAGTEEEESSEPTSPEPDTGDKEGEVTEELDPVPPPEPTPASPEEADEETPAEEEPEPAPPPPEEAEDAVPEGDVEENIGENPNNTPPPVPEPNENNEEGGVILDAGEFVGGD